MISKTLFRLIDGLVLCANKLCGIEPINFQGEEQDFLSYLLLSNEIGFAFRVSAVLATILLFIFTVFMIIRSIVKDKAEGTPAQIAVKGAKTLLTFFLVPVVVLAFITIGNAFMNALYQATMQNASSPGAFLFSTFAIDGGMHPDTAAMFSNGTWDYNDTDLVWSHMDLTAFPFIFSYITGAVVLFGIGSAMLVFVDRVLSIVVLYVVAPISISTSVLDDGARFKLWRDQFLSKFIMGYGMIIAINIYALVCSLVMDPEFTFFANSAFADLIMKLLIIAGGALTMQKSMALVGNLVSQGAGSNELRDTMSAGAIARMAKGAVGMAFTPLSPIKGILSDAIAMKSRDIGASWLKKVGLGLSGDTSDKNGVKDPSGSSGSQNNEKANYSSDDNKTKDAIKNEGYNVSNWDTGSSKSSDKKDDSNANNEKQNKNDLVGAAINNGDNKNNNNNNEKNDGEGQREAGDNK